MVQRRARILKVVAAALAAADDERLHELMRTATFYDRWHFDQMSSFVLLELCGIQSRNFAGLRLSQRPSLLRSSPKALQDHLLEAQVRALARAQSNLSQVSDVSKWSQCRSVPLGREEHEEDDETASACSSPGLGSLTPRGDKRARRCSWSSASTSSAVRRSWASTQGSSAPEDAAHAAEDSVLWTSSLGDADVAAAPLPTLPPDERHGAAAALATASAATAEALLAEGAAASVAGPAAPAEGASASGTPAALAEGLAASAAPALAEEDAAAPEGSGRTAAPASEKELAEPEALTGAAPGPDDCDTVPPPDLMLLRLDGSDSGGSESQESEAGAATFV